MMGKPFNYEPPNNEEAFDQLFNERISAQQLKCLRGEHEVSNDGHADYGWRVHLCKHCYCLYVEIKNA